MFARLSKLLLFLFFATSVLHAQRENKHYKKAMVFLEKKDTTKALSALQKCLDKTPDFVPAYLAFAQLNYKKDPDFSLLLLLKADSLQPNNPQILFYIGAEYFYQTAFERSKIYLKKVIDLSQEYPDAYSLLASIYLDENNVEEAENCIIRLKQKQPNSHAIPFYEAYAAIMKEDGKMALEKINAFHELEPENLVSLRIRGYAKYLQNNYDGAFFDLEKSLRYSEEKDTLNYHAHFYMGLVMIKKELISEAIHEFNECLKIKENAYAYYNRGIAKRYFQDYAGAYADFLKAHEMQHKEPIFLDALVQFYLNEGDIAEGLRYFTQQIQKTPKNPQNYYGRAELHFENDSLQLAYKDIQKAIELDSAFAEAYAFRAQIRFEYEEMLFMDREDYMDIDEDIEESFYKKLLRDTEADVEKALSLAPKKLNFLLMMAAFYAEVDQHEQAVIVLKRCIDAKYELAVSYMLLGKLYQDMGKIDLSIDFLLKALTEDKDYAEAYYFLATSYYKKDDKDKFCFFLKKAVNLGYETSLTAKCPN